MCDVLAELQKREADQKELVGWLEPNSDRQMYAAQALLETRRRIVAHDEKHGCLTGKKVK